MKGRLYLHIYLQSTSEFWPLWVWLPLRSFQNDSSRHRLLAFYLAYLWHHLWGLRRSSKPKVFLLLRSSAASVVVVATRSLSGLKLLAIQVDFLQPGTLLTHSISNALQSLLGVIELLDGCTGSAMVSILSSSETSVHRATTRIGSSKNVLYLGLLLSSFVWLTFLGKFW